MKWAGAHQAPDDGRGTLHSSVFGGARSAQSPQCQPTAARRTETFWPIVSLEKATFTTHTFSRTVSLTQFPQDSGCLATDYSLRIAEGNWERRAEDREDGMFRVFCLKSRCCVYSFLSFLLFFSSSDVPIPFPPSLTVQLSCSISSRDRGKK